MIYDLNKLNKSLSYHKRYPILYHASNNKLNILKAFKLNNEDNDEVIFASPNYELILPFAGGNWNDLDINQSIYNGKQILTEIYKGAFDRFLNRDGYIYHLKNEGFYPYKEDLEYIHYGDIKPYKIEYIKNVLEEIKKYDIELYFYPDLPQFMKNREYYLGYIITSREKEYIDKILRR